MKKIKMNRPLLDLSASPQVKSWLRSLTTLSLAAAKQTKHEVHVVVMQEGSRILPQSLQPQCQAGPMWWSRAFSCPRRGLSQSRISSMCGILGFSSLTRRQWPYYPASTRAVYDLFVDLFAYKAIIFMLICKMSELFSFLTVFAWFLGQYRMDLTFLYLTEIWRKW